MTYPLGPEYVSFAAVRFEGCSIETPRARTPEVKTLSELTKAFDPERLGMSEMILFVGAISPDVEIVSRLSFTSGRDPGRKNVVFCVPAKATEHLKREELSKTSMVETVGVGWAAISPVGLSPMRSVVLGMLVGSLKVKLVVPAYSNVADADIAVLAILTPFDSKGVVN